MKKYVDFNSLNEVINTLTQKIEEVENKMTSIENCYPVGAIYISTTNTDPSSALGFGAWAQIKDKFLLAAGSTYTGGDTGGEATHILTTAEMPSHKHTVTIESGGGHSHTIGTDMDVTYSSSGKCCSVHKDGVDPSYWNGSTSTAGSHTHTATVKTAGGGEAHNNMPPYLAVYIWKRTK